MIRIELLAVSKAAMEKYDEMEVVNTCSSPIQITLVAWRLWSLGWGQEHWCYPENPTGVLPGTDYKGFVLRYTFIIAILNAFVIITHNRLPSPIATVPHRWAFSLAPYSSGGFVRPILIKISKRMAHLLPLIYPYAPLKNDFIGCVSATLHTRNGNTFPERRREPSGSRLNLLPLTTNSTAVGIKF